MKNKCFLIHLLLIYSFSLSVYGQSSAGVKNDSTVVWNKVRPLTWNDYKGSVGWDDPLGNAMTSYKIEVRPETVLVDENDNIQNYKNLTVIANFYCFHSWVNKRTNNLLNHEQTHFDIAELFARKLRKRFEELKRLGERRFEIYYKEVKNYSASCREMQEKYDLETNHGDSSLENQKWKELIHRELDVYANYE